MKRLTFEVTRIEDLYCVHLGNGEFLRFSTKTKAENFVRFYKKVIQDNVAIINMLQPLINSHYRNHIFSLDDRTIKQVSEALRDFEERFEYVFKIFSPGNHNSFVFKNIDSCISYLLEASRLLYDYAKRYKNYSLKAAISPVLKNLELVDKQLEVDKRNLFVGRRTVKVKSIRKAL